MTLPPDVPHETGQSSGDALERRRLPRATLDRQLQYVHGGEIRKERVVDISEGGLRLETMHPVPVHARLKLFVPLPRSDSAASSLCFLEGEVVWRSAIAAGVAFTDPPIECLSRLRTFVRHAA